MHHSFQTIIINILAVLLTFLLLGLGFLVVDRIMFDGKWTRNHSKDQYISRLNLKVEEYQNQNRLLKENLHILKSNQSSLNKFPFYTYTKKLDGILGENDFITFQNGYFTFKEQILFEPGKSHITKLAQDHLKLVADILKKLSSEVKDLPWVICVEGRAYESDMVNKHKKISNWQLSYARALNIVHYLINLGIDAQRLYPAAFSTYHPKSYLKNQAIVLKFDFI